MLRTTLAATAAIFLLGSGAAMADCGRSDAGGTILGAVAGGLLGGLAGNAISRDMDCEDRPYAARSYDDSFHGQIGRRYEWNRGPDRGYIVTNREYRGPRGRLCRDFTQVVYRRGREFDRNGTACRRRDGSWEFL